MINEPASNWPIWFALGNAVAMVSAAVFVLFYHDRRYRDHEEWIDYSFSHTALGRAIAYYRFMGVSMVIFFALFLVSLFMLQNSGGLTLFEEGRSNIFSMAVFTFDMVLRGAFFDVMEHFNIRLTLLHMNREAISFVLYCFVFRMFFALTLLKILISFAWLYRKIAVARRVQENGETG